MWKRSEFDLMRVSFLVRIRGLRSFLVEDWCKVRSEAS